MLNLRPQVSQEIKKAHAGRFPHNFRRLQFGWLGESFNSLPDSLRGAAEQKWIKDDRAHGHIVANRNLFSFTDKISPAGLAMSSDDGAIVAAALDYSKKCELLRLQVINEPIKRQYHSISRIIMRAGIEPPEVKAGKTWQGVVNRMCCQKWWRARLRETHKRWVEAACIQFGSVRRGRSLYVSDDCLAARKSQRRRNDNALKAMVAECIETGEKVPLDEAVAASVSNPQNRRNEMMLRMDGMQLWAEENGHACTFLTITCPSRMHACASRGAAVFDNSKFDGSTPRQAQAYLTVVWARVRAELDRQGVTIYGVRIVEPHHDGTPHWHMIAYGTSDDVAAAESIYEQYACAENFGEWTGKQLCWVSTLEAAAGDSKSVRFKAKRMIWVYDDDGKLIKSPVAYVAKYIAKNLETGGIVNASGERLDDKTSDECSATRLADAVQRVDAWRSCWGVRQFQFFGSHAVTVWRELRRIKKDFSQSEKFIYDENGGLLRAVTKAESCFKDWPENVELWRAWYAANKHEYYHFSTSEYKTNKRNQPIDGAGNVIRRDSAEWTFRDWPEDVSAWKGWYLSNRVDGANWCEFMRALDDLDGLRVAVEPAVDANAYEELGRDKVVGLVLTGSGVFEPTRLKSWMLGFRRSEADAPWSPSNNRTDSQEKDSDGLPPDLKKREVKEMKKRYFYDKKTNEYDGMTNSTGSCPAHCVESDLSPADRKAERAGRRAVKKPPVGPDSYAIKVAGYSDRQIHGALIRAKSPKREMLLAEQAKRAG